MSDPNLILKDTGSVEQTNRLVCMYAETVFQDEQTLRLNLLTLKESRSERTICCHNEKRGGEKKALTSLYMTGAHVWRRRGGRERGRGCTMVQKNKESRSRYWTTCLSVHSFARTAHSFACSGLLASLAPSAALTRSLARSLRSLPRSWESV